MNLLKKFAVMGLVAVFSFAMVGMAMADSASDYTSQSGCSDAGYYWYTGNETCYETENAKLSAQVSNLLDRIDSLTATIAELSGGEEPQPTTGGDVPAECEGVTFDRALDVGMEGDDVLCLQTMLNQDLESPIADSGPGSPGNETSYFGSITKGGVVTFQEKYSEAVLAPWDFTQGTGYVGETTREKLNELLDDWAAEEPEPTEPGDYTEQSACEDAGYYWYDEACNESEQPEISGLEVKLADDNPVQGYVLKDDGESQPAQHQKEMVKYNLTAGKDTTVNEITFTRGGYITDNEIDELYLYAGGELIATTPSNTETKKFTFSTPFEINKGQSKSVALKADFVSDVSDSVVSFGVDSASDIDTESAEVNGDFPLSGSSMTVASVDLGTAEIDIDDYSVNNNEVGTENEKLAEFDLSIGDNSATVHKLAFDVVGSLSEDDLANFELVDEDGDVVAEKENLNESKKLVFEGLDLDLDADTYTYDIKGDIKGGADRTFYFDYDEATDFNVTDSEQGVRIKVTETDANQTPQDIAAGDFDVELADDSPLGDVPYDTDSVTLAEYDFTAGGERTKVTGMGIQAVNISGAPTLKDVQILVNGSQKGDTVSSMTAGTGGGDADNYEFDFGNSFVVDLGETATVKVVADLTSSNVENGDTFKIEGYNGTDLSNDVEYELLDSDNTGNISSLTPAYELKVTDTTISASLSSDTPESQIMAMGNTREMGRWTVEAFNGEVDLKTVDFDSSSLDTDVNKAKLVLYDENGDELESAERSIEDAGNIWFGNDTSQDSYDSVDNLDWTLSEGETYELALEYTFRDWASTASGANSGTELSAELKDITYEDSSEDTVSINDAGNTMLLRRSIPSLAMSGDSSVDLSSGSEQTLYSLNIKSNMSRSSVKKLVYDLDLSGNADFSNFKFYRGGTDITDQVSIDIPGDLTTNDFTNEKVIVTMNSEEELLDGDSYDYHLKADVANVATDDELNVEILEDTTKLSLAESDYFYGSSDVAADGDVYIATDADTDQTVFYDVDKDGAWDSSADISLDSNGGDVTATSSVAAVAADEIRKVTDDASSALIGIYYDPDASFGVGDIKLAGDTPANETGGNTQIALQRAADSDNFSIFADEGGGDTNEYDTADYEAGNSGASVTADTSVYNTSNLNFIWSGQVAGFQYHDSGTADWTNGYMVDEMPTTKRFLSE